MSISLIDLRETIRNLIDKNNTETSSYNISDNLNERVTQVINNYHENYPVPDPLYPIIFVELKNKGENFSHIGNTAKRDMIINFDIVGVVDYGIGVGREYSDIEMITLSQNLEMLFRNHSRLSATSYITSSLITNVEYDVIEFNDTWNSICILNLQVNAYSN